MLPNMDYYYNPSWIVLDSTSVSITLPGSHSAVSITSSPSPYLKPKLPESDSPPLLVGDPWVSY